MLNLNEQFAHDAAAAEDGRWFPLGPGAEICVRSSDSDRAQSVLRRLQLPYQSILRTGGTIPDAAADDIATKYLAEGLIVNWKGLSLGGESELAFNRDNAMKVMEKLPKFKDFVIQLAATASNFKPQDDAGTDVGESEGNSENT